MNAQQQTTNEITDYLRQHIAPWIAQSAEGLTPENFEALRSRLHALHHYCIQSGLSESLSDPIDGMLSTSAALWKLISENELTNIDLKDYSRVRTLAAEAEGLANLEEWISGEDTLRDIIVNTIAFMLNWKSNTIWIDSAKRTRQAMAKSYLLEIQDRIWQFIKESAHDTEGINLEQANRIRQRTDRFMHVIQAENLTTDAQIALLIQIYFMLLRLQLGQLILRVEAIDRNE